MASPILNVLTDLSEKCDKRGQALIKAIDALEEIRALIAKSRKPLEKERLIWICEKSLEQIEMLVDNNGSRNGGEHG